MAISTFAVFNNLWKHCAEKVHNLSADTLKVYLTNTAPSASNTIKTDLTGELSTANGYTAGGATVSGVSSTQTSGTYKFYFSDITWTASGGSIGPFRYAVLYNDTPTSPLDPLIGWWDYGGAITVADGDQFVLDIDSTNGIFTET